MRSWSPRSNNSAISCCSQQLYLALGRSAKTALATGVVGADLFAALSSFLGFPCGFWCMVHPSVCCCALSRIYTYGHGTGVLDTVLGRAARALPHGHGTGARIARTKTYLHDTRKLFRLSWDCSRVTRACTRYWSAWHAPKSIFAVLEIRTQY